MYFIIVLSNLHDIVGVRVDEETVRYFGKGHQVVLLFNTGVNFGITETFTYGNSRYVYRIKLINFSIRYNVTFMIS